VYTGELRLGSATVDAPFFNGEWWAVSISNGNPIKVGMNSHESGDGFQPAYVLVGTNNASPGGGQGRLNGFGDDTTAPLNKFAFQELRYYTDEPSDQLFRSYVMNPFQLGVTTGDVTEDVYNTLYFRAPLGSDGVRLSTTSYNSAHPRRVGAYSGFVAPSFSGGSTYVIGDGMGDAAFVPNKEFKYFNEPASGIKNRINRAFVPTNNSSLITGETLSTSSTK
jgi:hypothetical protein